MSKTSDVVVYLAENYPHKSELSKARLTKMVFLADWDSVKSNGAQITPIRWYFHNFGPYVDDVVDAAKKDPRLNVKLTQNAYGDVKEEIVFVGSNDAQYDLSEYEKKILDQVITSTQRMYWKAFIEHVYDTDPVKKSSRYSYLDLESFV